MKRKSLLLMMLLALFSSGAWAQTRYSGNGSSSDPYLIQSVSDWNTFADAVTNGTSYYGKYFRLTTDITVTKTVGKYPADFSSGIYNNSTNYCFQGTFDGNGKTITLDNVEYTNEYGGLFKMINRGATIKNLKVNGSVSSSYNNVGGIVGGINGYSGRCYIQNCWSDVTITSNSTGSRHCGIVAFINDKATIQGCVFTGKLLGSGSVGGGLFGHQQNAASTFQDCIFAPSEITLNSADSHILYSGSNGSTSTNCYYYWDPTTFGHLEGTQAYKVTLAANPAAGGTVDGGDPTTNYGFIKAYSNGLLCDGIYYANGSVSLNATANDGYEFDFWIKNGTETIYDTPYGFTVDADADFQAHFSEPLPTVSCTPSFSSNSDYIASFSLGSISNTNSGFSSGGYGNFTSMSTDLEQGVTANATLTSSSGSGSHYVCVWIDFNNNGEFANSEKVSNYTSNIGPSTTVQIPLTIPANAALGNHYMRVVYRYNETPTPCMSSSYGEGEDYVVNITAATTHTLTWSNPTGGTISVTNNGTPVASGSSFTTGTQLTITAEPSSGYMFTGWTATGGATLADASSASTTLTIGGEDCTLSAGFTPIYTVTVSNDPTAGGTSYIQMEKEIGVGGTATDSYLPCYTFYNYNLTQQIYTAAEIGFAGTISSIAFYNDGDTKTLTDLDFYMVHTNKTTFDNTTDWITVTANDLVYSGSSITMTTGQWTVINLDTPFSYNGTSNLAIITDEHMQWDSGLACRVFTPASSGNCSIRVYSDGTNYDPTNPTQYTGTLMTVKNQIKLGVARTSITVLDGTSVTLTAVPNADYHFVNWTENNNQASTSNPYTITVNGNHNFVANFALSTHTLTASVNPANSGTISDNGTTISGNVEYNDGTSVTLTANTATGYTFQNWTIDGSTVANNPTTITMDQDHNVVANFTLNQYTVTLNVGTGGTATGGGTYNEGTTAYIEAFPDECHTFSHFIDDNGTPISAFNPAPFNVDHDMTITVVFAAITYNVSATASPSAGGTVTGGGTLDCGSSCTLTATPATNYVFINWTEDGNVVSTDATYTINNLMADHSLVANFGADQTLTTYANPVEGGYVTIAENQVSTIGAVEVGDASASGVQNVSSPYWTSSQYSFEECLYLASEIGVADAYITSISYYVRSSSSASSQTDDRIEVYMKNTNRTSFSSSNSDMEAVTANDKVFDGTWHLTNTTGWVTIVLDKPFHYTGSSLMIGINEMTQGASYINFKFTNTATLMGDDYYSCRSRFSDTPLDPTSLTSLPAKKINDRANVRLGFGTYHYGQSVTLTAHANEGYQFVNWTENNTELGTNDTYTVTMNGNHTIYANFERLAKRFINDGNWNVAANWSDGAVPDLTEEVAIEAHAVIPSGVIGYADNIRPITHANGSITIQDGGQLIHNNASNNMVTVTVENTIASYDDGGDNIHNKGYEIVSFPVDNLTAGSNAVTGVFTGAQHPFDFYSFYASEDPLEWLHQTTDSTLSLMKGYIYASQDGTTIRVTGPVMSSANNVNGTAVDFLNANAPRFNGWALLGNPFVCNAYVSLGTNNSAGAEANFYKLNHTSGYDEFVPFSSGDAVTPMGGVMFRVYDNDNIVYSRTASSGAKTGILNMDVTCVKDRATVTLDRARVRFGEGRNLEKLQFDTRHTKVYIPEDGNDFSVYYADGAGTIPVNFKAQDNGRYTLDFSTEDVGFNYLHLIDNMNGNDVDLLQTPYYAFDAKSTDFASRFTLVFATGNDNDDTFAFFNNGVWIINNDGNATLQVVDALGRMLSSENISGSTSKAINVAPGVYMLRLINGDKVKVQKIVVKR